MLRMLSIFSARKQSQWYIELEPKHDKALGVLYVIFMNKLNKTVVFDVIIKKNN